MNLNGVLICLLLVHTAQAESAPSVSATPVDHASTGMFMQRLLSQRSFLENIPFTEIITAASGKKLIPLDKTDPIAQQIFEKISSTMNQVLAWLNQDSELQKIARINEVSSHVENLLQWALDEQPGFTCEFPKTAAGNIQRSGYPDLRLVHEESGRVCYVDPKLYAKGSTESTFRTFYFEPKSETNKVLDDAHHLVVGIEHTRTPGRSWQFHRWQLVDLAALRVGLKAEFEASNKALYRPETIIGGGPD
jgi:hypothetical protein